MFRFSRDKRFFLPVWFSEFLETATSLVALVRDTNPELKVDVVTCEDMTTYNYSTVTFFAEEVIEALKEQKHYSLEELSEEIWYRSFSIDVAIYDPSTSGPFAIHLSVDREAEPRRLKFYYQCISETLEERLSHYRKASLVYRIGDGHSKPSAFNYLFGQRLTGLS